MALKTVGKRIARPQHGFLPFFYLVALLLGFLVGSSVLANKTQKQALSSLSQSLSWLLPDRADVQLGVND